MKDKNGFTLVELLVVISLVAILLTLSLSVGRGIIDNGRKAKCLANLKQVSILMHTYASENSGAILVYLDNKRALTDRIWQQRLVGTVSDPSLFRCPAVKNRAEIADPTRSNYYYFFASGGSCDYGINEDLGFTTRKATKFQQIQRAASIVLLAERQNIVLTSRNRLGASFGLEKHNGGANVIFVDGHAEFITGTNKDGKWTSKLDDERYWNPLL